MSNDGDRRGDKVPPRDYLIENEDHDEIINDGMPIPASVIAEIPGKPANPVEDALTIVKSIQMIVNNRARSVGKKSIGFSFPADVFIQRTKLTPQRFEDAVAMMRVTPKLRVFLQHIQEFRSEIGIVPDEIQRKHDHDR